MASHEVGQAPGSKPRFFYGYIVVLAAFIIMMVAMGMYTTYGIFFKPLLTDFGWTRAVTSGAVSLSFIMSGLLGIITGRLSDRFGPRIVLTICGLLLGLGYLLMSQISALWHLYLFYGVVVGTGMSGVFVPATSTVARWFVKRRSIMTGIVVAGMGTGILIGPLVANWLISTYGWRLSYIILGSVVLLVFVLAAQFVRRDPTQVGQRPYGENEEAPGLKLEDEAFSLKQAVYTKQFWMVSAMNFCFGFSAPAIIVHIAPHAIELGISAASAATILATIGGLSVVGRVAVGGTADRIGNKWAFVICFILMAAALFWLVPAKEAWALYLFAVVFGFAFGGRAVLASPMVATLFGLRSLGLILGFTNLGWTIGAAAGPFMAGYIFDVTTSYQSAFLVCAAISVIGLILAAFLTPAKTN